MDLQSLWLHSKCTCSTDWMVLFISHCGEQTPVQEIKIRSSTDSVPPDWDKTLPGGCCREHGALHGCSLPEPGRTKLDCVMLSWNGSERADDEDVKQRRREGQQIIGHTWWLERCKNGIEDIIGRESLSACVSGVLLHDWVSCRSI